MLIYIMVQMQLKRKKFINIGRIIFLVVMIIVIIANICAINLKLVVLIKYTIIII